MSRLAEIVLVLRSLSWFEAAPETSTGNLVRRNTKPGEVPSYRDPCPECGGDKWRRVRGVVRPCAWCGGDLEQGRPGRGWVERDGMTGRQVGSEATGELTPRIFALVCDACAGEKRHGNGKACLRCRGSGVVEQREDQWRANRVSLSADARELSAGDPVCALLDRRADPEDLGVYWQAGLALGCLRLELPRSYRTIVRLYVECDGEGSLLRSELGRAGQLRERVGLRYLSELMPDPLHIPAGVRAVEKRRQYVLRQERRRVSEETAA